MKLMQNIEIKARCDDLAAAKAVAEKLGADFAGVLHQVDTYFKVSRGRLKLREINSRESQLIFYERPDNLGPKVSSYQIYPIQNSADLTAILTSALGIWRVIEKVRELYWWDGVRIHLDCVSGLGNFIELEGIIQSTDEKDNVDKKIQQLIAAFNISAARISGSYSDLFPESIL
jgi:predicted adenylyl cyclase CyaB